MTTLDSKFDLIAVSETWLSDSDNVNEFFIRRLWYGTNEQKTYNKEFENDNELLNEVACRVAPEILTRTEDNNCYKRNLVSLFKGALDGGNSHATNYVNNQELSKDQLYQAGSSFYKVWRYMLNSSKCN